MNYELNDKYIKLVKKYPSLKLMCKRKIKEKFISLN